MKVVGAALRTSVVGFVLAGAWLVACSASPNAPSLPLDGGASATDGGADEDVVDAAMATDAADATLLADAMDAADVAPIVLIPVGGHVEASGALVGATVRVLSPPMVTTTDSSGNFTFYLPEGANVVIKVEAPNDDYLAMIRGLKVRARARPRTFYLTGPNEQAAFQSLGFTIDPTKALVQIDFRNATQGGYSVTLLSGATTVTPGFGGVLDGDGVPQVSMTTLAGGNRSTLYLGDVTPGDLTFTPHIGDAGLPCQPCDGPGLPAQPNVVTWYDFECGVAPDCL